MSSMNRPPQQLTVWDHHCRGPFAQEQERLFLLHLTAEWRRRHRRLLQIECAGGRFLEIFWEAGFDVSGVASSPADLHASRAQVGRRADLHLAQPGDLRFEDKAYDYVLLLTVLNFCSDPRAVLREAARVCGKELLITFLNKNSLFALTQRLPWVGAPSAPLPPRWWTFSSLRSLVHTTLGKGRICKQGGILPGPKSLWHKKRAGHLINSCLFPDTFGAYCGLRVDMTDEPVNTPLMAWAHAPKPSSTYSR